MELKKFNTAAKVLASMPAELLKSWGRDDANQLLRFASLVPFIKESLYKVETDEHRHMDGVHTLIIRSVDSQGNDTGKFAYKFDLPTGNDFYKAFMAELGVTVESAATATEEPTATYTIPPTVVDHMKRALLSVGDLKKLQQSYPLAGDRTLNMAHVRLEVVGGFAQVIATDGHQMYMSTPFGIGGRDMAINIPVALVKALDPKKSHTIELYHRASGQHHYAIGYHVVTDVTHDYMDWKPIVPEIDEHIIVPVAELQPAIVQAVLKTKDCLKKDGKHAKITPTRLIIDGATLKLSTTHLEEGTETVSEVRYITNNTNRTLVAVDATKLDRVVRSLDSRNSGNIAMHTRVGKEMLLFKTPYQTVLLMPMLVGS